MSKRSKLLHILWSGAIGGTEDYVVSLIKYSDYSAYEIHLCFLSEYGLILEEAKKLSNIDVTFIGIKNGYDIPGALKFAAFLIRGKFDIIHSHMRNFLSTAVLACCTGKTPKILTHHVGPVDARLFKRERRFYKLFSGMFQKITAISGAVKKNLINDLDVKPVDKIKVIYNGIDLNKFSKSDTVPSDLTDIRKSDRYIIGFIGRMTYFKRPLLFIEISVELLKKNKHYFFVMVGDGPEFQKCRDMITAYKIAGNFALLGFRRDIPNILKLFDALIFTTKGEGFGIVLIEAMANGIPVFAVNDGAVPEIISHEKNGILLDAIDPVHAAQQISETIENKDLIDKIKRRSEEDAHLKYSINVCVQQMEKIYQEAL